MHDVEKEIYIFFNLMFLEPLVFTEVSPKYYGSTLNIFKLFMRTLNRNCFFEVNPVIFGKGYQSINAVS